MTCDTGANGAQSGPWVADSYTVRNTGEDWDNPLDFALFGLARQKEFPGWRRVDRHRPILDLGPGNKLIDGAIRCEYPEYNFENLSALPVAYPRTFAMPTQSMASKIAHGVQTVEGYTDDQSMFRCTLPWANESVGGIYAVNILEHLWDPRPIMEECARVLAPGCPLNIVVPHGSHGIYLQDLDHKKPFILDTWRNWLSNGYWGPDRSGLRLRVGVNFKFGIKEENVNIMTQLIKES